MWCTRLHSRARTTTRPRGVLVGNRAEDVPHGVGRARYFVIPEQRATYSSQVISNRERFRRPSGGGAVRSLNLNFTGPSVELIPWSLLA